MKIRRRGIKLEVLKRGDAWSRAGKTYRKGGKMKKSLMFVLGALCALVVAGCCCTKCDKAGAPKGECPKAECAQKQGCPQAKCCADRKCCAKCTCKQCCDGKPCAPKCECCCAKKQCAKPQK